MSDERRPPESLRRELLAILTTYGALAALTLVVAWLFGKRPKQPRRRE